MAEQDEKMQRIKMVKPSNEEDKKIKVKTKNAQKQLDHEIVRLNETLSKNNNLKAEIDTLRKELM
jgi:hypothetical protein